MAKAFERIFIIFLENKTEQAVLDNAFMKDLAASGAKNAWLATGPTTASSINLPPFCSTLHRQQRIRRIG